MAMQLTKNGIRDLLSNKDVNSPILQIVKICPINNNERFRAFISDGNESTGNAMFGTQLNDKVKNGDIDTNCIIDLKRFVVNSSNVEKKIIIILECEVLASGTDIGDKIGNPVPYEKNRSDPVEPMDVSRPAGQSAPRMNSPMKRPQPSQPSNMNVHPIASITPYQNRWTIKVRVTNKSAIREWSNSKGEGRLFSADLLDESGEIRATAFKDECNKFHPMLEINEVYYITGGTVKMANKQFNNLNNDYEITFNSQTQISPCRDANDNIPLMQYNFVTVDEIEQVDKDKIIDLIGVCKSSADVQSLTSKNTGKELKKRDIQLVDSTNKEVRMTLWGTQADSFDGSQNPIVAVKGAKVSDFGGKSLSLLSSSLMQINPDIREAHKLRAWFDSEGQSLPTVNLSNQGTSTSGMGANFKSISQAVAEGLGQKGQPDYYTVKATVTLLRQENCLYPACPSESCNKKVVDLNNGVYRCEKCSQEYDTFKWRLMLSGNITDCTDNVWITVFQEQAESLLGCTAAELASKKEIDQKGYQEVFTDASFKEYIFKLRVKMETYNDENKLRTTAVTITPLNPIEYSKKLIDEINKLNI